MAIPQSDRAARGHIADALRAYLDQHDMKIRDFNAKVLHIKPGAVTPYGWLACRSGPSAPFIPLLAKALKKPESFFQARWEDPSTDAQEASVAPLEPDPDTEPQAVPGALQEAPMASATTIPVVSHARRPPQRDRERYHLPPEPSVNIVPNTLSYSSNGNGGAVCTMYFQGPRSEVAKVFTALLELGVDLPEKKTVDAEPT